MDKDHLSTAATTLTFNRRLACYWFDIFQGDYNIVYYISLSLIRDVLNNSQHILVCVNGLKMTCLTVMR
jgi:hypothetical protein